MHLLSQPTPIPDDDAGHWDAPGNSVAVTDAVRAQIAAHLAALRCQPMPPGAWRAATAADLGIIVEQRMKEAA